MASISMLASRLLRGMVLTVLVFASLVLASACDFEADAPKGTPREATGTTASAMTSGPIVIQAEAYSAQSGTGLETCSDTGGGQDVGWFDTGDYLEYANVAIPTSGPYTLLYRYAYAAGVGNISLAVDGTVVSTTSLPATGGWQTWQNAMTTVTLSAGTHTLRLTGAGFNLNYFTLETYGPIVVQAESYSAQSGTELETCSDTGGGQDVGWFDTGDYLEYANVAIPTSSSYTLLYRYAYAAGVGNISLAVDGTVVSTTSLPATGGWQTWQNAMTTVTLSAGTHTLRLTGAGFNLNYFTLTMRDCTGKVCGSDGYGGSCGTCASPTTCNAAQTACVCTPSCTGKVCGSDGCGGSCGTCASGTSCNTAQTACESASAPIVIQAESYSAQSGTGLETCSDTGGGQDVGWINTGDYLDYANVAIPTGGSYTVRYRYAGGGGGNSISLAVDGTVVSTTSLPWTGGWQTWQDAVTTVTLSAGTHTLRLTGNWFNLNYFSLSAPTTPTGPLGGTVGNWKWVNVPGAVCGNGSPAGFAVNVGTGSDLMIYLEGGGACWDEFSCRFGGFGLQLTYNFLDGYGEAQFQTKNPITGVFDRARANNPYKNASMIYVPQCTGDFHSGSTTQWFPLLGMTAHFAGRQNLDLFLAQIVPAFPNASRVTLMGSSAGGFGATINFGRVQTVFGNTRVDLVADSGPMFWNAAPIFTGLAAWNTAAALPPGCADCQWNLRSLYAYYSAAYPNSRIAVTSYDQDSAMSLAGYAMTPFPQFYYAMQNLTVGTLGPLPNVKYFVAQGFDHANMPYNLDRISQPNCLWQCFPLPYPLPPACFPIPHACGQAQALGDWLTEMHNDSSNWHNQTSILQ